MKDRGDVQSSVLGTIGRIEADVPGAMNGLTGVKGRMSRFEASWREENKAAIEKSNAELERNGLWCDTYRIW